MPLDQGYDDPLLRNDRPMPLGDHLEDLRRRLFRALLGVVAALGVSIAFGFQLIGWLAQPLLQVQSALGYTAQTIVTEPTAGFTSVYLPVTLISALILASPWVLYQLWGFVVVGLYKHERKAVYILTPFSTLMTALGVLFARYVLLPVSLLFFLNFATYYPKVEVARPNTIMLWFMQAYGISPPTPADPDILAQELDIPTLPVLNGPPSHTVEGMLWIDRLTGKLNLVVDGQTKHLPLASHHLLTPLPQMGQYVRFAAFMTLGVVAAFMTLGVVAAFQLPVVMLLMGWTRLFDPQVFANNRKYAVFICLILGAVLTPTDIFSMFVLSVPLYLLFEVGLLLLRLADRRPVLEIVDDDLP